MTSGILLLAVIGTMFAVMFLMAFGQTMDEGPGDLDHFDHEPSDPSSRGGAQTTATLG